MRRFIMIAARLGFAIACSTLLTVSNTTVHAAGPTVTGAGSTWVQIALDQWRADIARQGYSINYQGVGSSAGRNFYIINQVDFAASEIPFQPGEVPLRTYQYLPDVAGATTLMYNLHTPSSQRITNLRLDPATAAKIFTGAITSWQDPAIQGLNPGLRIAETTVIPVTRSDGSGTSAQFSLYLADQASNEWNAFVSAQGCPAPCSQWPPFGGSTQQSGSDGVANFVANNSLGPGSIGYVEAGYAFGRGMPVAALRNGGGSFVQLTPANTAANVSQSLTHATLNADLTQNLTGVYRATEPNAYPMSSYSYMITPCTSSAVPTCHGSDFDPAKGQVLGTWLIYIACGGQQEAGPLGYSPLPANLVQVVFDAIRRIPGAPTPPPIDSTHCPNPTITNAAAGGSITSSTTGTSSAASTNAAIPSVAAATSTAIAAVGGGSSASTAPAGNPSAAGGPASSGAPVVASPGSGSKGSSGPVAILPSGASHGGGGGHSGGTGLLIGPQGGGIVAGPGAGSLANPAAGNEISAPGVTAVLPSGVAIETLGQAERQAVLDAATVAAGHETEQATWPLWIAAVPVLLAVFGPPLLRRRRAETTSGDGDDA